MKMQRISTSFDGYTDADFEQKADYILEQMTGNLVFDKPVPPLPEITALRDAYSEALVEAAGSDRPKVAIKNQARTNLEVALAKLGMHVMSVALGNVAMLASSGFTLLKSSEPQYISNPGSVSIANGVTSGELVASVTSVKAAKSYLHQITTELPTEATHWVSNSSSRCKFTYTNLQPGKQYWVRIGVVGSRGQIAYSPVASQFAQ